MDSEVFHTAAHWVGKKWSSSRRLLGKKTMNGTGSEILHTVTIRIG